MVLDKGVFDIERGPRGLGGCPTRIECTATRSQPLRIAGHELAIAESGSHAPALAREFKPEVALVDIGMPEMDGYELARRLRGSLDGPVRVIAVPGYADAAARERAKDAGFDGYLVKPAGFEDTLRVVR